MDFFFFWFFINYQSKNSWCFDVYLENHVMFLSLSFEEKLIDWYDISLRKIKLIPTVNRSDVLHMNKDLCFFNLIMIFYPIYLKEICRFLGSMIRDVLHKSDVRKKLIFWTWKEYLVQLYDKKIVMHTCYV